MKREDNIEIPDHKSARIVFKNPEKVDEALSPRHSEEYYRALHIVRHYLMEDTNHAVGKWLVAIAKAHHEDELDEAKKVIEQFLNGYTDNEVKIVEISDSESKSSNKKEFYDAIDEDEYAEYELSTGDVLITDWEGNSAFNPYVVPVESDENSDSAADDIHEAIQRELDIKVRHVEWRGDEAYAVHADKPEDIN